MGLRKYLAKRNFHDTPEPKGGAKHPSSKKLAFVIQEHHASRLHYDFRLELDGVMKSWAIPKGPSMNPHEHHLAIMTEDHPYDYRKFEGIIPEGSYGAGNVIIWDEGTYEPYMDDGKNAEAILRKQLKKGHLTFMVHGKKLQGEFALIKMGDVPRERNWLLIKKGDKYASARDITKQDESVKSGKTVDEIGAATPKGLDGYPKQAQPRHVKPMLCTLVDEVFDRDDWLFEVKWDGYRAIASKQGNDVELYSRNDLDFREHYPPVVEAIRNLKHNVVLDGEIVVLDNDGRPHFEWIQNWRQAPQDHLHYYAFDILWCDGHDVRTMPLIERKALLKNVLPRDSTIRYSDHIMNRGKPLLHTMQTKGLEGIVAKRADSPYRENVRGQDWLKIKTHLRQEVVIGGYTEPRGSRQYLGSLVVGLYKNGKFVYVGHSGGGIPDEQRKQLREKLKKLERHTSPFVTEPTPNAPVHWVEPKLICEMSFSEWTSDGSMRHPKFEGIRTDKQAMAVHREKPQTAATIATKKKTAMPKDKNDKLELTHLDKVFFPKHKYTKGDIIEYYRSVSKYMLPYLKDRPLSLNRQPNGVKGESFFQKNHEHLPSWVPHADIYSDSNEKNLHWIVGGELDTLLYVAQLGSIEINPWNSRVKHLNRPDWIVIDLDPEGARTFKDVISVAKTVHEVCQEWDVPCYPKTSGKTGIHIFIPMGTKYTYEQAKNFAHLIVIEVNTRQPKITSLLRMPDKRKNKIYLDFLQNREGQTLAAPYSLRPTPDATVAAPLHWDEVTPSLKPTDFTIKNMPKRLEKIGDIWRPVMGKGIDLSAILKRISA